MMIGETASDTVPASGSVYYKIGIQFNRSYAVMAWQPFEDAGEGGSDTNVTVYLGSGTCTVVQFQPNVAIDNDPDMAWPGARGHAVSFISSPLDINSTKILRVENRIASAYAIRLLVVDTTLNSPWWFTVGTNNAFVEIRNNAPVSRTMTLTAFLNTGVACGTTTAIVPGNGNMAINIKDYPACAAVGVGSARLTYAGAPGAFVANITTIDGVLGTSFDAPFFPMMGWGSSFTAR
jgi:hypothetical protein